MRIELQSNAFDDVNPSSTTPALDIARAASMSSRIYNFTNTEERDLGFDADFQTPLATTGKTATMGKKLLLSQKI